MLFRDHFHLIIWYWAILFLLRWTATHLSTEYLTHQSHIFISELTSVAKQCWWLWPAEFWQEVSKPLWPHHAGISRPKPDMPRNTDEQKPVTPGECSVWRWIWASVQMYMWIKSGGTVARSKSTSVRRILHFFRFNGQWLFIFFRLWGSLAVNGLQVSLLCFLTRLCPCH